MEKESLISAIVNAKSRNERDAVIEKYGKQAVGQMLLKLKYIKEELERDQKTIDLEFYSIESTFKRRCN